MKKEIPKPHIYASCPKDGIIMDYYSKKFEAVYILLHPFLKSSSLNGNNFTPDNWPSKIEEIDSCIPIPWSKMVELCDFNDISEMDVALRTSIKGIKKKFRSEQLERRLDEVLEKNNIIQPTEGDLPPLLENRLYDSIKKLGYNCLWLGDEFSTERKLHFIDNLKEVDIVPGHGNLFTNDEKILITTHWDSHCSYICSSKSNIEKIIKDGNFEGFYCTDKTHVYWGLYDI